MSEHDKSISDNHTPEENILSIEMLNDTGIASDGDDNVQQSSPNTDENLKAVEDLTLAELLTQFFKQPRTTATAFREVIKTDNVGGTVPMLHVEAPKDSNSQSVRALRSDNKNTSPNVALNKFVDFATSTRLIGYGLALIFVVIGNVIMAGDVNSRRTDEVHLANGLPYLVFGFFIWLATELLFAIPEIMTWWRNRSSNANTHEPIDDTPYYELPLYLRIPVTRWFFALAGMIFSGMTWFGTANNTFSTLTFYLWLASIVFWSLTFAPLNLNLWDWLKRSINRLRNFHWRKYAGVILALLIIMTVAFHFRCHRLDQHPREMTDDHVEKILDAGRVRDGARNIFFANNGGREPIQMYLIALASHLPGLGINFYTIKFVSAIESLLTIPVLFWMGYALLEGEDKRRRLLLALIIAALAAVSYWHVAITRQGLRIPLTPLIVALNLIYLMRGIRHNRRSDFIIAGLLLGFGLYTYQAVRMLPIVIVIAVIAAIIFNAKTIRQRLQYMTNLTVLVAISFVVFLPMFRYSVDFPELFWRRTTGRLLGDDVIQETLPDGTILYRDATAQERLDAFVANLPTIASNIRNVLLMFNWEGDVATISGVSTRPSMDIFSGALLIVGIAAWLAFAVRRRDTAYWLIPLIAFLMLLPSALSIAFPDENPSHTRTSGAIPLIYLLAAFPLALIVEQFLDHLTKWQGKLLAASVCVLIIVGSYHANAHLYFNIYPDRYEASFDPYSDAGRYLYGYILSGGAYGNSYLIGYEHWWSHRAVGIEAGLDEFWPNGIYPYVNGEYSTDPIVQAIHTSVITSGTFAFQPDANIIFLYSPEDEQSSAALAQLFPTGTEYERTTYKPDETFMVYEIPALGVEGLQDWLLNNPPPQ